jgi:hypothetical protein
MITLRQLTHITVYGLFTSQTYAEINHDIQQFAAVSLQHFAAYLQLDGMDHGQHGWPLMRPGQA